MKKDKLNKRFKYISFKYEWSHKVLKKDFKISENPTEYKNLPNGEYVFRSKTKGERIEYWVKENVWYLTSTKGYNSMCDYAQYRLFKQIPHKEYLELRKHWERLNRNWQKNVSGYFFWLELRQTGRNCKKIMMLHKKKRNEKNRK